MSMCMLTHVLARSFCTSNDRVIFHRAQRRAERQAERRTEEAEGQPRAKRQKKQVPVSAEMAERQKRAAERMAELGVPPLLVRIRWRPGCTCYFKAL